MANFLQLVLVMVNMSSLSSFLNMPDNKGVLIEPVPLCHAKILDTTSINLLMANRLLGIELVNSYVLNN